jgi:hypothetical protein
MADASDASGRVSSDEGIERNVQTPFVQGGSKQFFSGESDTLYGKKGRVL